VTLPTLTVAGFERVLRFMSAIVGNMSANVNKGLSLKVLNGEILQ
jgi:hypothetical protein